MSRRRALPVEHARGQLAGTPLCMEQYYRLFTSYRYPGLKTDTLKVQTSAPPSVPEHIIVARKNQVRKGKMLHTRPYFWLNPASNQIEIAAYEQCLRITTLIVGRPPECCPTYCLIELLLPISSKKR